MRKIVVVLMLCTLAGAVQAKYVLNYKRLNTGTVAISCANGADPTGTKVGETVIISCGVK